MQVLITGATGFIGSHLLKACLANHWDVIVLKRSSSDTSRISSYLDQVKCYDLDRKDLQKIFEENKIDQIIHLATSYGRDGDLQAVFESNFVLPKNLLDLSVKFGVKRFINTDSFSSKQEGLDYLKAYHSSKRMFREWGQLIVEQGSVDFISVFLQHPYGPSDNPNKFVSFIIRELLNEVPHIDLTAGLQLRDFIYISDVISAFTCLIASEKIEFKEIDLGTGESNSIKTFVEQIKELANNTVTELRFGALPTRKNEILHADIDNSGLRKLGWEPRKTLRQGILSTIEQFE